VRAKSDLAPNCDVQGEPMYRHVCRASELGLDGSRDLHVWRCARKGCGRYFYGTVGYRYLNQTAGTAAGTPRCSPEGAYLVVQRTLGSYICPVARCPNRKPWIVTSSPKAKAGDRSCDVKRPEMVSQGLDIFSGSLTP
jgi:hypothetical protein